jgi:hypothetical protein
MSSAHTNRLNHTRRNKLTSESFVSIHVTPLSKQNSTILVFLKYKQYSTHHTNRLHGLNNHVIRRLVLLPASCFTTNPRSGSVEPSASSNNYYKNFLPLLRILTFPFTHSFKDTWTFKFNCMPMTTYLLHGAESFLKS